MPEGQAYERRAHDDLSVALALTDGKRGHTGEEAEIGRERLAVREPGCSPEHCSPHPGDGRVDDDREPEWPGSGGVPVGELERRIEKEEERGRPAPQPHRIFGSRARLETDPVHHPRQGVGGRLPGVQHRPDVSEQDDDRYETEPEDDVDERRGDIPARRDVAHVRGYGHEHEEAEGHRSDCDAQCAGQQDRLEPRRQGLAPVLALQERSPPEDAERDERDEEDKSPTPGEEPRRYRKVFDASDTVRDEQGQGVTLSSAI